MNSARIDKAAAAAVTAIALSANVRKPIFTDMAPGWAKAVATAVAGLLLASGAALGAAPDVPDQCLIAESDMATAIAAEDAITYDSNYRASCPDGQAPAFPGAQGFGACVTGGRGGRVIEVTSLLATRDPGTLQWALDQTGPRTIVFRVSGVIDRAMEITQGDVTIAGQTSPGGITVRGILCDNQVYERQSTCTNVIVRHIRSRPVMSETRPGQGYLLDDAARIDGGQHVIADHLSLSGGEDETFQISRASDITVQNSTFSELMSAHEWSGMLINYSSVAHPLQNISLHHNAWNRQQGRLPEINCEPNTDDGSTSNCSHRLNLEVSSNLTWDQASEITYGGTDGLRVDFNWVANMGFNRPAFTQPLIAENLFSYPDNRIYVNDDRYFQFPQLTNYALAGCCNDWASDPDYFAQRAVPPTVVAARIGHPEISYTPAASVMSYAVKYMGAFPRDPQDRRLLYPIAQRRIATAGGWNTRSNNPCGDSFTTDAAPVAPLDTDHDGMPDEWEAANGLNPAVDDAAGNTLALLNPVYAGMTNVEVYLHERHLQLLGLLPSVPRLLSVAHAGNGSGVMTSIPAGINCGALCSAFFTNGTSVTLSATAGTGSTFAGWSGAGCSGTGTCAVNMTQSQSVTAIFTLISVSSASPYDGIYQWDPGYYLSVHQIGGGVLIGTIYWVYNANTEQVGRRAVPDADTFDLSHGQIVGSTATMAGTRFYRACTLSYDFTFNLDASLTVRHNSVSNSPGVSVADVDCAARYNTVGSVWTIPRIY